MYKLKYTVSSVQCLVYTLQYKLKVYSEPKTNLQNKLYTVSYSVYSVEYTVNSVYFKVR